MNVNASRSKAVGEADTLVLLGKRLDFTLAFGSDVFFNPDATLVQIDADESEIGRNRPIDVPVVGDERATLDYLLEEVLQRQPVGVRSFLLRTSILDRLSGPLCDAVCSGGSATGQDDGREVLEALERSNLFVVPLDDKRQWYRYHHLFADVLKVRLMKEQPDQVPSLHRRASEWYEQNDLLSDAIRHALVAEDFERAAGLDHTPVG
jgi:ATP/maltotriose-dependent transcriptional regulator MalT